MSGPTIDAVTPSFQNANPTTTTNIPPEAIAFASRLFDGARNGDNQLLRAVLGPSPYGTSSLSPNLTNDKGDTLLMLAAYHGQVDTVRLLFEFGADPDRVNDRGQSPLAGAIFKCETEVVKELMKGGAGLDVGRPSARECVEMFGGREKWRCVFGDEEGAHEEVVLGVADGKDERRSSGGRGEKPAVQPM